MPATMENITVSVPSRLVSFLEKIVKEDKTNRSKIVSKCIEDMARERTKKLMEEGYRAMAEEHKQFAKLSAKAAAEVVPAWK